MKKFLDKIQRIPLSLLSPSVGLLCILATISGCNLSIELDAHPYGEGGDDNADVDLNSDIDATPPPVGPKLLITELMIQPTSPPSSQERLGQYIEVFNAGDQAIDPSLIVIEILETNGRINVDLDDIKSTQEQAIVDGLEPIEPGGFFVFLREDDPHYGITDHLEDGQFYEYGKWNQPVPMSTSSQTVRLLQLRGEFEFRIHHELGWRQGALIDLSGNSEATHRITEDVSLGLRAEIDNASDAADPDQWCFHIERFGDGPLYGSPGVPSPERCL